MPNIRSLYIITCKRGSLAKKHRAYESFSTYQQGTWRYYNQDLLTGSAVVTNTFVLHLPLLMDCCHLVSSKKPLPELRPLLMEKLSLLQHRFKGTCVADLSSGLIERYSRMIEAESASCTEIAA